MHADDALGTGADRGDLRDRDARRVRGEHGVIRHVLLELREHLVLELELLRHGLEHEVGAFERGGQLGLEAERPTVLLRGVQPFEHALGHRHAALGALERLVADVVERRLDARAGEHRTHAGAHRPRSDHCCASYLGHAPSFFSSWIRPPHAFRRQRQLGHGNACVGDRSRHGGGDGRQRSLATALGPVGPRAVLVLDDDAVHLLGHVLEARHAVVEQGLVQQQAVLVDHLLVERVAEALQRAALVLALDELRVDGPADVGDGRRLAARARGRSPRRRPPRQLRRRPPRRPAPPRTSRSPSGATSPRPISSPPASPKWRTKSSG